MNKIARSTQNQGWYQWLDQCAGQEGGPILRQTDAGLCTAFKGMIDGATQLPDTLPAAVDAGSAWVKNAFESEDHLVDAMGSAAQGVGDFLMYDPITPCTEYWKDAGECAGVVGTMVGGLATGLAVKSVLKSPKARQAGGLTDAQRKDYGDVAFRMRYATVYDAIVHLDIYQAVMAQHMAWVGQSLGRVLDMGMGTGIMMREAMDQFPERSIYGVDFNTEMADQAASRNIPSSRVSTGPEQGNILTPHIDGKRIPDGSIGHAYSHSVLWNLELEQVAGFFTEAARILRKADVDADTRGGTLAISTVDGSPAGIIPDFLAHLDDQLKKAEVSGAQPMVTQQVRQDFVNQNAMIAEVLRSTPTADEIIEMAEAAGLRLVERRGAYQIPTPDGGTVDMFTQLLFERAD